MTHNAQTTHETTSVVLINCIKNEIERRRKKAKLVDSFTNSIVVSTLDGIDSFITALSNKPTGADTITNKEQPSPCIQCPFTNTDCIYCKTCKHNEG